MNAPKTPASSLGLVDAISQIQRLTKHDHHVDELKLRIVVYRPGCIGGTPKVDIERIQLGFDWDAGSVLLFPVTPLSALSQEEKAAILANANSAQTHHAYQQYKRIKELEAEVASLKTALGRP